MRKRGKGKTIGPQKAVNQRSVRAGKTTNAKGRKSLANQKRVKQRSVPSLRYIGSEGGRQYFATKKKRR